jgi:hypothetical protein
MATYSRTAGETIEGSPYTISAALSPAGVLGNYNITYNTANFTITAPPDDYTLTIDIAGNGTVTKDPDQAVYHYGDVVTLTATPDLGWNFGNWSENVVSGQVTIHGNTTVTATFTRAEYTLTIEKTGNGTVTKAPNQATYHYGDEVTLTATPDLGWTFGSWSPNVVDGKVTIHDNTTVTATFTPVEYTLTINITGNGTVVKEPDKATYHEGDVVTLTATPDPTWSFGSWSANVVDSTVTIHGNTTVTATFVAAEYTLTIEKAGNGTVTPDKIPPYHMDDVVVLTAVADEGWTFSSWTGCTGVENTCSVTMDSNKTVTATFTQNNTAPSFTSTPVTTANEDALYTYNITVADANNVDTLTITAPTKPAWLTFTDNGDGTATLTGTPTNAEVGSHDVVLHVSDGTLGVDQSFSINVVNVNDAPAFTSTPVTTGTQGAIYTYNVMASDPDAGAVLTITAPTLSAWLTLTDNGNGTAVLTGTPGSENVGINNVTLNVSDGTAGVDQTFTIDVGNINDGPSFTSTALTSVNEDSVYTYEITTTDPDAGDTLTISAAQALPAWLTLADHGNRTATLTGTPTNNEVGDHSVVLQVTDGLEVASQPFAITVVNVNDAPVLTQPEDQNNAKGAVVSLQLSATDVDAGDVLTYSASGLPGGLSLDPASGLISGTITGDANTYTVTAGSNDGHGGTDSKTFNWVVTEQTYTLTINVVGNGSVVKSPDQATYVNGTEVTLTATPDAGWVIDHWSANVVGGKVTISGDTTVTVTFTQSSSTGVVLGQPSGTLGGWDNTFHWTGLADAEYYHVEVYDSTDTKVVDQWYTTSICSGLACVVSPAETASLSKGSFKWHVQTYGAGGFSPWTEFQSFTINAVNLGLTSPTGALTSWNNSFHWTGISSAEYYHMELRNADNDAVVLDQWFPLSVCTGLNCAASPADTQNLVNGNYKWRLQTYSDAAGTTAWTNYLTFSLNAPVMSLNAPSGTQASWEWDKKFHWTGIPSAEYYHTQVYDAASNTLLQEEWYNLAICNGLNCAVSPSETRYLGNGQYKWRVQTYGTMGYTPWTEYATFTINSPTITLNAPVDTLTSWDKYFRWTGIASAEYYHTQVYDALTDALVQEEWYTLAICNGLNCAVSPAETRNLPNGTYRWRVQSYGSEGYTPWTGYITFTLNYPVIVLNAPRGTLTSWNNTFQWTGLSTAEYYHVQVYTTGGALVQEEWYTLSICSGLECTVSPTDTLNLANGDYKWRVQSYGTGGYTPWTDYKTFTLIK